LKIKISQAEFISASLLLFSVYLDTETSSA